MAEESRLGSDVQKTTLKVNITSKFCNRVSSTYCSRTQVSSVNYLISISRNSSQVIHNNKNKKSGRFHDYESGIEQSVSKTIYLS